MAILISNLVSPTMQSMSPRSGNLLNRLLYRLLSLHKVSNEKSGLAGIDRTASRSSIAPAGLPDFSQFILRLFANNDLDRDDEGDCWACELITVW